MEEDRNDEMSADQSQNKGEAVQVDDHQGKGGWRSFLGLGRRNNSSAGKTGVDISQQPMSEAARIRQQNDANRGQAQREGSAQMGMGQMDVHQRALRDQNRGS